MPYYAFKEIFTPLTLVSIRLFREVESGKIYIKLGNKRRRPLFK